MLQLRLQCRHCVTILITLAALIGLSKCQYTAEAEADRVTALPGAEELKSGLFSGCEHDLGILCVHCFDTTEASALKTSAPIPFLL